MVRNNLCNHSCPDKRETHVHEVIGSVRLAGLNNDLHNHRFTGITDEEIPIIGGHIHKLYITTDFYDNHFHSINVKTGPAIAVSDDQNARHVHFIDADTDIEDLHFHGLTVATMIENPIGH
jgi:hypothetical protein